MQHEHSSVSGRAALVGLCTFPGVPVGSMLLADSQAPCTALRPSAPSRVAFSGRGSEWGPLTVAVRINMRAVRIGREAGRTDAGGRTVAGRVAHERLKFASAGLGNRFEAGHKGCELLQVE
jgi:hypothetical protein